ncbi:MAG: glycogen synthase [Bacteroidetes bacterium]|nr:glycogen synthase [Bacteroidota bacterium]
MSNLRILFVANEVDPFLNDSFVSKLIRDLAKEVRSKEAEVRVLVPKFGVINDRKSKLHEVVRLSGININVGNEDKPLIIKVASIREERIQVYFIDNEEYFKRKLIFKDKQGKFLKNNSEKLIFFSKGILETIKQLEWSPNVIHCNGWFSSLVPMYIKTLYKNEPVFKDSKCIFTIYNNQFEQGLLSEDMLQKEPQLINEDILTKEGKIDYFKMLALGARYSDIVTRSYNDDDVNDSDIKEKFSNIINIPISSTPDFVSSYEKIYQDLIVSSSPAEVS